MTRQIEYWESAQEYTQSNDGFDGKLCQKAWHQMLSVLNISEITSILECGSNLGRNVEALHSIMPKAKLDACDVNQAALMTLTERAPYVQTIHSSILRLPQDFSADLVFTSGVLIHIDPSELIDNLGKIYELTKKYIVFVEYFSPNLEIVRYRDRDDLLWKQDFGDALLKNFKVEPLQQGFLWRNVFGAGGFDDCVYWVFRKNPV